MACMVRALQNVPGENPARKVRGYPCGRRYPFTKGIQVIRVGSDCSSGSPVVMHHKIHHRIIRPAERKIQKNPVDFCDRTPAGNPRWFFCTCTGHTVRFSRQGTSVLPKFFINLLFLYIIFVNYIIIKNAMFYCLIRTSNGIGRSKIPDGYSRPSRVLFHGDAYGHMP